MVLASSDSEVSRLSAEEVKQRLDRGDPIFFADVRRHPDNLQVEGARYYDPETILAVDRIELPASKDQLVIIYCT
jgi:hypothetical protein